VRLIGRRPADRFVREAGIVFGTSDACFQPGCEAAQAVFCKLAGTGPQREGGDGLATYRMRQAKRDGRVLPACAELIALLPDKRRVFITISVGTFKEGLIGKPAFFSAAIEQKSWLYMVRRLYGLPEMLRATQRASSIEVELAVRSRRELMDFDDQFPGADRQYIILSENDIGALSARLQGPHLY